MKKYLYPAILPHYRLFLSFLTRILDSDVYIDAAETARGIFEMDTEASADQQREFMPVVQWVDNEAPANIGDSGNIVKLVHSST